MRWFVFLPGILGVMAVIQGGLNRQISGHWGLASATLFNSIVLLVASVALFALANWQPARLPDFFHMKGSFAAFHWWYLIPGLCGLALVAGIPFAINRLGAFSVFLGIVGGQLVMSLVWDALVEHRPVTLLRLAGAGMAMLSVWLVGRQG